ncbi:hypothetical protein AB0A60_13450 [Streptomyces sp. NPDC046275]|uniref:hypothetical protein n=1 Tax=Streptomyces sp. NPDC046275 TaxID=3157201 RepID=UPI003406C99A
MPEEKKKRFDLSLPQVAGSALAAVLAAKLASTLGVYGTILGAGVISVIATCGGPLLQHLLKRTGEQMREVTATGRPRPRQAAAPRGELPGEGLGGEFNAPTTHGTRVRGWKRSAVGAAAVFLLAMGGITAYELTSGQDLAGTRGTTTFGSAVRGQGGDPANGRGSDRDGGEERRPATDGTSSPTPGSGGGRQEDRDAGGTPTPDRTPGAGTPTPGPTSSASTEPTGGGSTPTTTPPTTAPTTPAGTTPPAAGAPAGDAAE